jgi:hypothetical protein
VCGGREYRDVTANTGLPTGANFPTHDEEGNLLDVQFGESTFTDQQVWTDRLAEQAGRAGRQTDGWMEELRQSRPDACRAAGDDAPAHHQT